MAAMRGGFMHGLVTGWMVHIQNLREVKVSDADISSISNRFRDGITFQGDFYSFALDLERP